MSSDKHTMLQEKSSEEPSSYARAKAFNALTKHPDCLKDDTVMNDLIDEIASAIDQAHSLGRSEIMGTLKAVVHAVGGQVEGHPTSFINVLQRVRELVTKERFTERAHKTMTPDEYAAMPIVGWHYVCRDYDGFGGTGVRFITDGVIESASVRDVSGGTK